MPGDKEKKKEKPHHRDSAHHTLNTADNAFKAVVACRMSLPGLSPGYVWSHLTHHGDRDLKGAYTLADNTVLVLHFSPQDGSVLPKGLHGLGVGEPHIVARVKERLEQIKDELLALDDAEFREPESCWAVPIAYQGRIVGHMKVSADGSRILKDKKASDEIAEQK